MKWQQQLLVLPLSVVLNTVPQSFQLVLHDWCNKGCGMCYPVCGMVHACCYSKRVAREVAAAASRSPSLSGSSLPQSFQPVLHDWCNKGRRMCYPVCGMVHIKEPLLLIDKSSLCGGSRFPFSLSEWSLTICLTPYNRK